MKAKSSLIRRRSMARSALSFVAGLFLAISVLSAEQGVLVVYVSDTEDIPLSGVAVTVKGDGGTAVTQHGKARIRLRTRNPGESLGRASNNQAGELRIHLAVG